MLMPGPNCSMEFAPFLLLTPIAPATAKGPVATTVLLLPPTLNARPSDVRPAPTRFPSPPTLNAALPTPIAVTARGLTAPALPPRLAARLPCWCCRESHPAVSVVASGLRFDDRCSVAGEEAAPLA